LRWPATGNPTPSKSSKPLSRAHPHTRSGEGDVVSKAKTGKTPQDFAELATRSGLTKHGEVVAWLKRDFALGHGHATAIAGVVLKSGAPRATADQKLDKESGGRFETAGAWNAMVTHRVRIGSPGDIDAELIAWLKSAYEAA
jgi:hypothetical protein